MLKKLLLVSLVVAANAATQTLYLVGGNIADDNKEIWSDFVSACGGSKALIGIITAASTTPEENAQGYADVLKGTYKAGAAEWIPIDENHTKNAEDSKIISRIKQMTCLLFGGGDQARIITSFYSKSRVESTAMRTIRDMMTSGVPVLGSSAGTAVMPSATMILGGESWYALAYGGRDTCSDSYPYDLCYDKAGGIGFFLNGYVDTHFSHRGRQGRLVRMVADLGKTKLAFGIDENTVLITSVDTTSGAAKGKVMGESGVWIFDLNSATSGTDSKKYFYVHGVKAAYATDGDTVDLTTGAITFGSNKKSLTGREPSSSPITSTDIFSSADSPTDHPFEFVKTAQSLYDSKSTSSGGSTYGDSYDSKPRYRVKFTRGGKPSEGADGPNGYNKNTVISFHGLTIDMDGN